MAKLDEIDYAILRILMKDSHKTYRQIEEKVGISIGTIHNRMKKLIKNQVILNFSLNLDYSKLDPKKLYYGDELPCFSCIHHSICELFNSLTRDNGSKGELWIKKFLGISLLDLSHHCKQYKSIVNEVD